MKKYDVVVAGYICVDLVPTFPKSSGHHATYEVLRPGRLIEITGMESTLGGVVANTGIALKKFSRTVYLNGLLGRDFIGRIAMSSLEEYGLAEGIKTIPERGTAFGLVISPPGIDRIFLESPGCSELFDFHCIDFVAIENSRLFHFGYPPLLRKFYRKGGAVLCELFQEVSRRKVITSLDFSLPDPDSESGRVNWGAVLEKTLPHTDIFMPSLEEALKIIFPYEYTLLEARSGDMIDLISLDLIYELGKALISYGADIVLLKAAHRGIFLWVNQVDGINQKGNVALDVDSWNNQELYCRAYPVDNGKVKNASGAGDTAGAAFLTAVLEGYAPDRALKYAALAGRNNLYCNDIFKELSDWESMTDEISKSPHVVQNITDLISIESSKDKLN